MTWHEAQSFCRSNNSDLVTVTSQEMNQKLSNISKNYLHGIFWIGLYHDRDIWQWPNGEKTSYYNWKRNLFCAYAKMDGSWMDSYCDVLKPFICYKETKNINRSYFWINESVSWSSAQNYCRVNYKDLVSIRNENENQKIMKTAQRGNFWIGLFNNQWKWSDGQNSTFQNWDLNWHQNWHRDYESEKCGIINPNGKWSAYLCNILQNFFCSNSSCGPLSCTTTYLFISDLKSWYDAQRHCRSHYTDLVTVENQTVNDQLLQISGQRKGWIGFRHGNDTWQWSNGDQLTYRNWNPTRYCAQVQPDGSWADSYGYDQIHVMCYKEMSNISERYVWINETMDWSRAQNYCRVNYNDLVSIKNERENQEIMKKAQGSRFWIGLFNNPWKWSDGGTSTFRNWYQNSHWYNPKGEKVCVFCTQDGKWEEGNCIISFPFFCSKRNKRVTLRISFESKINDEIQNFSENILNELKKYIPQQALMNSNISWVKSDKGVIFTKEKNKGGT
ncbi:macrophage mannose receptor 1-like [Polypterus senegalus]|uniref:macrophage mannose receptor 1-like n=1 Tax=Polypterus senegalus TaxID=55291 RepID=UPI0019651E6C|nr:macrophage mannose receptor 1-like [Polypterus senegalus]